MGEDVTLDPQDGEKTPPAVKLAEVPSLRALDSHKDALQQIKKVEEVVNNNQQKKLLCNKRKRWRKLFHNNQQKQLLCNKRTRWRKLCHINRQKKLLCNKRQKCLLHHSRGNCCDSTRGCPATGQFPVRRRGAYGEQADRNPPKRSREADAANTILTRSPPCCSRTVSRQRGGHPAIPGMVLENSQGYRSDGNQANHRGLRP
ncbi:unnamed protein product [Mytilus coruscus]|uniref:Uncharacterized protein n=1 Tax=Mytilus coruscus TaxID=42192 RepID=A0A6J8BXX4_MYTCO|nr:unnamed protein product [Mytilus coruscus]